MRFEELEQGLAFFRQGEWQPAYNHLETALKRAREQGARQAEATALNTLGTIYLYRQSNRQMALAAYEQALAIFEEVGDEPGQVNALINVAAIRQANGEYTEAKKLLERVIELDRKLNSPELPNHRVILGAIRKRLRREAAEAKTGTETASKETINEKEGQQR